MTKIYVTLLDGTKREFTAASGQSLMEALRNNGVDDLMAICGGMMSCATCHIYLDTGDSEKVEPRTSGEQDVLEMSSHLRETSRLSCQIPLTDGLDSLHLEIAPED